MEEVERRYPGEYTWSIDKDYGPEDSPLWMLEIEPKIVDEENEDN